LTSASTREEKKHDRRMCRDVCIIRYLIGANAKSGEKKKSCQKIDCEEMNE